MHARAAVGETCWRSGDDGCMESSSGPEVKMAMNGWLEHETLPDLMLPHSASWSWIKRLTTRSLQKHTTSSVKPFSQIYTTCVCWDTEELGFVLEKLQCGVFSTKWSTTNHFWLRLLQAALLNHGRRQRKRKELLRLRAQQPLMSSVSKPE